MFYSYRKNLDFYEYPKKPHVTEPGLVDSVVIRYLILTDAPKGIRIVIITLVL